MKNLYFILLCFLALNSCKSKQVENNRAEKEIITTDSVKIKIIKEEIEIPYEFKWFRNATFFEDDFYLLFEKEFDYKNNKNVIFTSEAVNFLIRLNSNLEQIDTVSFPEDLRKEWYVKSLIKDDKLFLKSYYSYDLYELNKDKSKFEFIGEDKSSFYKDENFEILLDERGEWGSFNKFKQGERLTDYPSNGSCFNQIFKFQNEYYLLTYDCYEGEKNGFNCIEKISLKESKIIFSEGICQKESEEFLTLFTLNGKLTILLNVNGKTELRSFPELNLIYKFGETYEMGQNKIISPTHQLLVFISQKTENYGVLLINNNEFKFIEFIKPKK